MRARTRRRALRPSQARKPHLQPILQRRRQASGCLPTVQTPHDRRARRAHGRPFRSPGSARPSQRTARSARACISIRAVKRSRARRGPITLRDCWTSCCGLLPAPYQPGEFSLRELPPLRAVLEDLSELGLLVVDGYADLDPGGRPGLGARARAEFGIPVIGWPSPGSARPPTRCRSCADPRHARCSSQRPGCPQPTRRTWSGAWPAGTGCPTHCAAPIPSPGQARPQPPGPAASPTDLPRRAKRGRSGCSPSRRRCINIQVGLQSV